MCVQCNSLCDSHFTNNILAITVESGYLAFGLSGSSSASVMKGADVVVVYVDKDGNPQAVDYTINDYSQVNYILIKLFSSTELSESYFVFLALFCILYFSYHCSVPMDKAPVLTLKLVQIMM